MEFPSQNGKKAKTTRDKALHESMLRGLDGLDKRTKMAGTHSVLRVLISHPASPNPRGMGKDNGNHPAAVVIFEDLNKSRATQQILDSLSRNILVKRQLSRTQTEQQRKRSRLR